MLEPVGCDTAPAVAMAALLAFRISPDARLLVLPAGHVILNEAAAEVVKSEYQISATVKTRCAAWSATDGVDASRIQAFAASYHDAVADPTTKDPVVHNPARSPAR